MQKIDALITVDGNGLSGITLMKTPIAGKDIYWQVPEHQARLYPSRKIAWVKWSRDCSINRVTIEVDKHILGVEIFSDHADIVSVVPDGAINTEGAAFYES